MILCLLIRNGILHFLRLVIYIPRKNYINHYIFTKFQDLKLYGINVDCSTEAVLLANGDVGLEINPEKTNYMVVSRLQKCVKKITIY